MFNFKTISSLARKSRRELNNHRRKGYGKARYSASSKGVWGTIITLLVLLFGLAKSPTVMQHVDPNSTLGRIVTPILSNGTVQKVGQKVNNVIPHTGKKVAVNQGSAVGGKYDIIDRVNTDADANIVKVKDIPGWDGKTEILKLAEGKPNFTEQDLAVKEGYQHFSKLDNLGRPGQANAVLTPKMQPKGKRTSISAVTPPGWKGNNVKVKLSQGGTRYFYDRSHLIGYQLGGVNAEPTNLVTGAREFNAPNMLQYENQVDGAIEAGHSVRYQVTPIYNGEELVSRGVQMRAYSIDDSGSAVQFNVFIYNVNVGYSVDYATGHVSKG